MNNVSAEHLKEFDGYIAKWQVLLNLKDWRIERGSKRPKSVMADVVCQDEDMLAVYRIGLDFGATEVTSDSLERAALHEVLHVRLRKFKMDPSIANEHEVINVFEKLLMELGQQR